MNNEEVKEEVEKVPEEVQVVAEEVEEIKDLKESGKNATRIVMFDDMTLEEERFTNIKKLKCDYTIYKNERTKLKMPVITKCQKCCKSFKAGDELYSAYKKSDETGKKYLICKNCAKK